jgi:hypothetical protein
VTVGFVSLLHSGHSIGATDFVILIFGYAAGAVFGWHELARR